MSYNETGTVRPILSGSGVLYQSPLGPLVLTGDAEALTGLWFQDSPPPGLPGESDPACPVFPQVFRWLDCYFSGSVPDFMPPLHMMGTPFRQKVWQILLDIPYGKTITYGEIARILAKEQGDCPMSAQAVGNAVGHNEISIVIPCHRVVGAKGNLVGYAGGIERKIALLKLEQVDMSKLYMPKFSKYSLRS